MIGMTVGFSSATIPEGEKKSMRKYRKFKIILAVTSAGTKRCGAPSQKRPFDFGSAPLMEDSALLLNCFYSHSRLRKSPCTYLNPLIKYRLAVDYFL